ncbi:mitochondrial 28s ribosomal protein s10 [Holotrichia oblita]|uniref:Mitochondrial 28s ribosomal protein s10 n=1 Tax=Holotrichia oblita TaxID=644536 RepID=A0ACB9TAP8_HOLOL|nr:mitochondrial 28s ribosomal protein s10 [Holotrichia oblita]
MNSLKQTIQKITHLQLRNTQNSLRLYSSASPQAEEELDKLYKRVELELRGNDPAVLNSYAKFATMAGNNLNIESKSWNLRKPTHERHTVLKSVHIYKKHRVQYEVRTYYAFVQYKHLTGSTADTLLEYIQRNLPEGVALKTSKVELQQLPDYISSPKI